jgi:hypothetical protein
VQHHPTPAAPAPFEPIQTAPAPWPSGHLVAALFLFGLVGGLRVVRAIGNREVFGFEATTALLALLWWPFVARELFGPRVRQWLARRRARAAASVAVPAVGAPSTGKPATVIRIADRRRPR